MDDDVQNLVLAPFQEIVEKGKTALENATDAGLTRSDDMFKAAQALARDGERALKKLEPVCKRLWEEYSTNFVVALKENGRLGSSPYLPRRWSLEGSRRTNTQQMRSPTSGRS